MNFVLTGRLDELGKEDVVPSLTVQKDHYVSPVFLSLSFERDFPHWSKRHLTLIKVGISSRFYNHQKYHSLIIFGLSRYCRYIFSYQVSKIVSLNLLDIKFLLVDP